MWIVAGFKELSVMKSNVLMELLQISDDETKKPKIKVEIKPITSIQKSDATSGSNSSAFSASVDEIRSVIGGLELALPPSVVSMNS